MPKLGRDHRHGAGCLKGREDRGREPLCLMTRLRPNNLTMPTIALLALAGLPMSDNIGPLAVRAMQHLHNHAITRVTWGLFCVSYTPRE
jgi:hypothetical protein